MEHFSYRGEEFFCEDVSLREVAQQFGTPLYIYSKQALVDSCRQIEAAFEGREHRTWYAVKANSNRALLSIICNEGLGADVNSRGELYLALEAGFPPAKITFSGVGKRDDEILYALEKGIEAFNVESEEELIVLNDLARQLGITARILARVYLNIDAGGHAYVSTSLKQNKFGMSLDDAGRLLRSAQGLPHIEVRGIHSHIGSQITRPEPFVAAAELLSRFVGELHRGGIPVGEIDFGGGFGVQYRGYVTHPLLPVEEHERGTMSAEEMVKTVFPVLLKTGCRISIQPGRSIVAQPGVLVTRVLYRKMTEAKTFIIVDGGMNDLLRPSLYNAHHQIVPLVLGSGSFETVDVVGPLCETGDFFARDRVLPAVHRGEYLALMGAGAYGFVLSSNYNARPRPAEVLIDGATATCIRERESVEEL
ncbi:MAG: diaminopimelate decarboxylase [Ignavibacteria bacterium]|nr:diaminopimelate decarboxylase [Ignavibacteria bacterium]